MGRMKARLKNILISGIVFCTIVFVWILTVTREGKSHLYIGLYKQKLSA